MMERVMLPAIQKEYMNNTKVSKIISSNAGLMDTGAFDVMVIPKSRTITIVNLRQDSNVHIMGADITPYDMVVMDAIYTLYKYGICIFSPQMVLRIMSGNMEQDATSQKMEKLVDSINKLRYTEISIDCTEELRIRKKIGKKETARYKSYLLPASEIEVKSGNQVIQCGFKILEQPALYMYAEMLGQIIDIPAELLKTQKEIADNDEVIVLKRYLIQRIAAMKNDQNHLVSTKISYEWRERGTGTDRGMYAALGYRESDYKDWKDKRKHLHRIVKRLLTALQSQDYIAGFQETKDGLKITGMEIFLPEPPKSSPGTTEKFPRSDRKVPSEPPKSSPGAKNKNVCKAR